MDWINSLPQPFLAGDRDHNGKRIWWPVNDFEVQTGLYRIDVCGKLDVCHIGDHFVFMDGNGVEHGHEDFFVDSERAINTKVNEAAQ
ncbi:hypothetical protein [Paraburkholderia caballeronis]|uniref:hypothetical protein n=1 Tax=Paraburkholderia caballeronis TaxID=416943 RepID=UPI001066B621|nr:hypothetical protein [Paraburkholderia caballeronis]TDV06031.1 hypothetical protein C7408_12412 [Paraburkholderia caballeronis]TDV09571.1 hypothetical protein C7406_12612 [Paraburkholderia caballeronis]TDV21636.1 hypothetical protein C7404_12112 [Paraburkholderia caballeronis]